MSQSPCRGGPMTSIGREIEVPHKEKVRRESEGPQERREVAGQINSTCGVLRRTVDQKNLKREVLPG